MLTYTAQNKVTLLIREKYRSFKYWAYKEIRRNFSKHPDPDPDLDTFSSNIVLQNILVQIWSSKSIHKLKPAITRISIIFMAFFYINKVEICLFLKSGSDQKGLQYLWQFLHQQTHDLVISYAQDLDPDLMKKVRVRVGPSYWSRSAALVIDTNKS
jgi:hypothetical protein